MEKGKCPACGSQKFYVKNPEDEYDIRVFECQDDGIVFKESEDDPEEPPPDLTPNTQTFCTKCAWHDCLEALQ